MHVAQTAPAAAPPVLAAPARPAGPAAPLPVPAATGAVAAAPSFTGASVARVGLDARDFAPLAGLLRAVPGGGGVPAITGRVGEAVPRPARG